MSRRVASLEVRRRVLDPPDFGRERGGALREGGTLGLSFRHRPSARFRGFARVEQSALGRGKPLVRRPLIVFELADRLAGLALARLERQALLVGPPPLEVDLLPLATDTRRLVAGLRQAQLELDDRLFLAVLFFDERGDGRLGGGDRKRGGFDRRAVAGQVDALSRDAIAQILDRVLGREDAAGLRPRASGDEVGSAEDFARGGHDRKRRRAGRGGGRLEALGQPGGADGGTDGVLVGPHRADDGGERGHTARLPLGDERCCRGLRQHDEPAPPRPRGGAQSGVGVGVGVHEHMLQQIPEAGFGGALVSALDLEMVRDRSGMRDAARRRQDQPRRLPVLGVGGILFFEGREPRRDGGGLLLPCPARLVQPLSLGARGRQRRFLRDSTDARLLERRPGARESRLRLVALGARAAVFDVEIFLLHVEA